MIFKPVRRVFMRGSVHNVGTWHPPRGSGHGSYFSQRLPCKVASGPRAKKTPASAEPLLLHQLSPELSTPELSHLSSLQSPAAASQGSVPGGVWEDLLPEQQLGCDGSRSQTLQKSQETRRVAWKVSQVGVGPRTSNGLLLPPTPPKPLPASRTVFICGI